MYDKAERDQTFCELGNKVSEMLTQAWEEFKNCSEEEKINIIETSPQDCVDLAVWNLQKYGADMDNIIYTMCALSEAYQRRSWSEKQLKKVSNDRKALFLTIVGADRADQ